MPSIAGQADRHVDIDRRHGHYTCFPDLVRTASGRILCAYHEFDRHAGQRRKLLLKASDDQGRTWSAPTVLEMAETHCPRLTMLDSGEIHLLDANGRLLRESHDEGRTFGPAKRTRASGPHAIFDRPLQLDHETLLSTGHAHRGSVAPPNLGQPPSEQMVYISENRGLTYKPLSVLSASPHLVLCEASMCLAPGHKQPLVVALMRENAGVFEPMYLCLSEDGGRTWTDPEPTPLVGHRPTLAPTKSGRLLVTYRDVGPNPGTAAFIGSLEELRGEYLVHGAVSDSEAVRLDSDGMRVAARAGTLFALRPMTDTTTARAELTATFRVLPGQGPAAGIHFGCSWRFFADRIEARLPSAAGDTATILRRKLKAGQEHHLRLSYEPGLVTLRLDGRKRAEVAVPPADKSTRPILWGSASASEGEPEHTGGVVWKGLELQVDEPRFLRHYRYQWTPAMGLPHAPSQRAVLELDNSQGCHYGDFGYSGWCETEPGRFVCAYHHAEAGDPAYTPSCTAHVRAAFFSEDDWE